MKLDNTIRRFAEAGLKCIITELDMGIPSTSTQNKEAQARDYRIITDIVLNNNNCPNMVIWGLKDNNSWRESSNPLLYTSGIGKKPAWYAVRSALRHRTLIETGIHSSVWEDVGTQDTILYDLLGRRMNGKVSPGLYITKEGRKVIVR